MHVDSRHLAELHPAQAYRKCFGQFLQLIAGHCYRQRGPGCAFGKCHLPLWPGIVGKILCIHLAILIH